MARNILKSNNSFVATENWGTGDVPAAFQTGAVGYDIVSAAQFASFGISSPRQNLKQVGTQGLVSQKLFRQPDVNLSLSYIPNWPIVNDWMLPSFNVPYTGVAPHIAGTFTNILSGKLGASRNFYIINAPDRGVDAFDAGSIAVGGNPDFSDWDSISFGNCYCTSYSLSYGVGALPRVTTDFIASNMKFDSLTGGPIPLPAINLESGNNSEVGEITTEVKTFTREPVIFNPTDTGSSISLQNFQMGGQPISGLHFLQSVDLSIDFPRVSTYRLGSNYPCDQKPQLPAQGSFSFSSLVSGFETGNLTRGGLAPTSTALPEEDTYQFDLVLAASGKELAYRIEGATLESYSYSMAVNEGMNLNGAFNFEVTESAGLSMSGSPPA